MRNHHLGQYIRDVGPASHHVKAGTPSLGGVAILPLWVAAVCGLAIARQTPPMTTFVLASGTAFAAIGAADDLVSIRRRRSMGLTAGWKVLLTVLVAALLYALFREHIASTLSVPFSNASVCLPAWATFLLTVVVFLAATNALNLTDGLDGLAGGCSVLILLGFTFVSSAESVHALALPLAATIVGFLWLNAHPARLILGDVGSYLLGGAIAALALGQGTAFTLPVLAAIPVLEAISVLLQVPFWRLSHRRLFRMAPLHHHFEGSAAASSVTPVIPSVEWKETTIVARFLIVQALFVGLAVLATRVG